ncbi:hypothetical protein BDQ12DRAFT_139973 [Crucibulum laeve]|uniref:INO80 complex subunit B-like conserved region domain-containing protein n=1 Tax=Crucibulum laeve TaxID=68775 RepID=A0A5C3M9I4_9AGAR|nr:hypothetical protein BDQ12DRAFT_139973 [Crucibulum laeve]
MVAVATASACSPSVGGLKLKDDKRNRDNEDEKGHRNESKEVVVSPRKRGKVKKCAFLSLCLQLQHLPIGYIEPNSDSESDHDGTEASKKEDELDVEIKHNDEEQHKRHEDTNGDNAEGENHTRDEDSGISICSRCSWEASPRKEKMTACQAALASVLELGHASFDTMRSHLRKCVFNDTEIAVRKVQKARKRCHFTERKLEDEKVETVNRLLKK